MSDFGYDDEFSGVCRVVINRIAPAVKVIDLTHGVQPGDIRRGAMALAAAIPHSAPSVLLAVVDPGVGSTRRAVALSAGGHHLVGPDNGLLWPAAEAAGGVKMAFDISGSSACLESTRRTFHGRDIFSPVAARLALGEDPADLGEAIPPDSLVGLEMPVARIEDDLILTTVLASDRYGNLALSAGSDLIEQSFLRPGSTVRVERMTRQAADAEDSSGTGSSDPPHAAQPLGWPLDVVFAGAFADVAEDEALLYADSSGRLSLAVNRGDASSRFDLGPDDELRLSPA